MSRPSVAILDDYQNNAFDLAEWSNIKSCADITVFSQPWKSEDDLVEQLQPFTIISLMRERTALPARVLNRYPI